MLRISACVFMYVRAHIEIRQEEVPPTDAAFAAQMKSYLLAMYHAEGESQSSRRRNHRIFRAKLDSFFSEVNGGYFEKNHKLVKYIGFGTAYEKEEHVRSMATAILNFFLKRMITIVEQKKWQHRLEQQILKS